MDRAGLASDERAPPKPLRTIALLPIGRKLQRRNALSSRACIHFHTPPHGGLGSANILEN
jgi:hypothetical protein